MEQNKIYTGFGDKGYTRTSKNMRIPKSDSLIELLGCMEEFTAELKKCQLKCKDSTLSNDLEQVARDIDSLTAELNGEVRFVTNELIHSAESLIDRYQSMTASGKGAENELSAELSQARAVLRRGERAAVKVGQFGRIQSALITYINRLGDLILTFAQYAMSPETEKKQEAASQASEKIPESAVTAVKAGELNLALAKELAEAAERQAVKDDKRIVVAIVDKGANLMLLHAMDDAFIASVDAARKKAYTAAALRMPTHAAYEMSKPGGAFEGYSNGGDILLLGGGCPLTANGRIYGAIGISGGTAAEDIQLAGFCAEYFKERI